MANGKSLVKFNVQNPKYAMPLADGWGAPKSLGDARKIALEANTSTKNIYGNGRVICTIINDKGKTGTLSVNTVPDEYEVDMGRKIVTARGIADIKQTEIVRHCLYFETCEMREGNMQTVAKTWAYNIASTRPAESYEQTEDDITESAFELPLDIIGVPVMNADGTPHKRNGVTVYAWQMTVTPEDPEYDTFGDAVVLPVLAAPKA